VTQALSKLLTIEQFLETKPENGRYELHDGAVVEMSQPIGLHEEVTGFLAVELSVEIKRFKLPFFIPKTALVQSASSDSVYSPDVLLLNRSVLKSEQLWEKSSTVQLGASIPLIVEVVSTNWRDDYNKKMGEYVRVASRSRSVSDRRREEIGVAEYWIVDYLGLGGMKYIGNPKQRTISVYQLIGEEYQVTQFRGDERVISATFPELNLTAQQIFDAGS
jgi:Uma2 family endonuclease